MVEAADRELLRLKRQHGDLGRLDRGRGERLVDDHGDVAGGREAGGVGDGGAQDVRARLAEGGDGVLGRVGGCHREGRLGRAADGVPGVGEVGLAVGVGAEDEFPNLKATEYIGSAFS